MPRVAHDVEPRFGTTLENAIQADVIDAEVSFVGETGYAGVPRQYAGHLVAWAPFCDGGQLRSTKYDGNRKRHTQAYVQQDGAVNVGTEEWAGRKVVILILDPVIAE